MPVWDEAYHFKFSASFGICSLDLAYFSQFGASRCHVPVAVPTLVGKPLQPPSLVVAHAGDLLEPSNHHAAVRPEGEELGFEQVRDGARNGGAEFGQGLHGHARDMPVQTLVEHGVHPDRAHYGLAWVVVVAAFAEVVCPENGALESHGLALKILYGHTV